MRGSIGRPVRVVNTKSGWRPGRAHVGPVAGLTFGRDLESLAGGIQRRKRAAPGGGLDRAEDELAADALDLLGVIEGNQSVSDNDWESITRGGDRAIKSWIDDQMRGKPCAIVLIGSQTAGRKWINYEIEKAWNSRRGVLGVYVHNLKDHSGRQSTMGKNPFNYLTVGNQNMSDIVDAYNPPHTVSTLVYDHIKANLGSWIDEAITIRNQH